NPYMTLINETIAKHGAAVPPNDRNTPGPLRLTDPRDLERLLRGGSFSEATAQPLAFEWDFATPEEFWENRSVNSAGPYSSLSPADQASVKAEVFEATKRYLRDGRIRFPASTLVVRARR
ncbi:MAG TPA: hypothetical protein VI759_07675, partial [Dehalococcoidia bacterium]|nr:hypothetical protein [Dehalococcoidia bacterium]